MKLLKFFNYIFSASLKYLIEAVKDTWLLGVFAGFFALFIYLLGKLGFMLGLDKYLAYLNPKAPALNSSIEFGTLIVVSLVFIFGIICAGFLI